MSAYLLMVAYHYVVVVKCMELWISAAGVLY